VVDGSGKSAAGEEAAAVLVPSGFQACVSSLHRANTAMAVAGSPQPGEIARIPPPLIACRLASALIGSGSLDLLDFGLGWGASWGCNMSSIDAAGHSFVDVAGRVRRDARLVPPVSAGKIVRLTAVILAAASLAACARSSVVSQRSDFHTSRQASLERDRAPSSMKTRVAVTRKHTPFASHKDAAETKVASQGLASFYSEGTKTASGERFDARELTAAHPSLPFGTMLRVTDVKSGRSVTVRVNDRGPYVPGRIVDVSHSAAAELGMIGKGVANVRLDVVR
jgi:rare lipoprotein A